MSAPTAAQAEIIRYAFQKLQYQLKMAHTAPALYLKMRFQ